MKYRIFLLSMISLFLLSCQTRKKTEENSDLNYMQNIEQIATEASVNSVHNTLQRGDQLVILVMAKDADVVKPFNQNYSSGELLNNPQPGGNISSQVQQVPGPTYVVDSNGDIDFPVIGRLNVIGKTLEEFKGELRGRLTRYIINPTVSARLTNYKVTVLGEVSRPGEYVIPDGKATLLSALGMAGDLTMYGKRNDVLVVRNVDGEISKERINLTDANFINSPYYNLKQGDVIYVSANQTKEKTSKMDPHTGTYISIASVALGLLGIFITLFKK